MVRSIDHTGNMVFVDETGGTIGWDSVAYIHELNTCNVQPYPMGVFGAAGANGTVCGGRTNNQDVSTVDGALSNECWKLNLFGEWTPFKKMWKSRSMFTLTQVANEMFAIGGKGVRMGDSNLYNSLRSIEKISLKPEGNWKLMRAMPMHIQNHCTVAINDSFLMVIGGASKWVISENIQQTISISYCCYIKMAIFYYSILVNALFIIL